MRRQSTSASKYHSWWIPTPKRSKMSVRAVSRVGDMASATRVGLTKQTQKMHGAHRRMTKLRMRASVAGFCIRWPEMKHARLIRHCVAPRMKRMKSCAPESQVVRSISGRCVSLARL
eukprot:2698574-Pleurochrysis_carterae.AAC.2